jgi:hypothetical protein
MKNKKMFFYLLNQFFIYLLVFQLRKVGEENLKKQKRYQKEKQIKTKFLFFLFKYVHIKVK